MFKNIAFMLLVLTNYNILIADNQETKKLKNIEAFLPFSFNNKKLIDIIDFLAKQKKIKLLILLFIINLLI